MVETEHRRGVPRHGRRGTMPRAALAAALGMLAASSLWAQLRDDGPISGAVTVTQPLVNGLRGDMASYVIVDPSPHGFAPWASAGLRWEGLLSRAAHPVANVGVRLRGRSLRLALGISRDFAYGSLGRSERPRGAPSPAQTPDTLGGMTGVGAEPVPITSGTGGSTSARAAYAMQAITDLVSSMEWEAGPLALGATAGWRVAGPAKGLPWYSASVAVPLLQSFALVGGVDRRYDRVLSSGEMRLTLGLQWRAVPWARRSADQPRPRSVTGQGPRAQAPLSRGIGIRRLSDGIRVTWPAPAATRVELRSDLTGWAAVPLQRTAAGDGEWQLDLVAAPGVHRLALRVDGGEWAPPAGLPLGSDGYGGAVGLLIVAP